jgi:hypothetical protein
LHSNVERLSLELKVKLAVLTVVLEAGPLAIEVLGGVVSRAKAEDVPTVAISTIATLQTKKAESGQPAR